LKLAFAPYPRLCSPKFCRTAILAITCPKNPHQHSPFLPSFFSFRLSIRSYSPGPSQILFSQRHGLPLQALLCSFLVPSIGDFSPQALCSHTIFFFLFPFCFPIWQISYIQFFVTLLCEFLFFFPFIQFNLPSSTALLSATPQSEGSPFLRFFTWNFIPPLFITPVQDPSFPPPAAERLTLPSPPPFFVFAYSLFFFFPHSVYPVSPLSLASSVFLMISPSSST